MRIFSSDEVERLLDYPSLIQKLHDSFSEDCTVPIRQRYNLPGGINSSMLIKPAWREGGPVLVKIVSVFPNNGENNLPSVNGVVLLFDRATGVPVAVLDGRTLTNRRTAATSALASRFLAREDSSTHLIVGTGQVAFELARAYRTIRPIRKTLVWGRNSEKAALFVRQLCSVGVAATLSKNLRAATEVSDIISCATLSIDPLIKGDWLSPGAHLDLVGGYRPDMREADDVAITRCRIYVDTREGALSEAGDLTQPIGEGLISSEVLEGELSDVCRGIATGRQNLEECTLFKSVGSALEDLAAAELVWDRTRK